MLDDIPAKMFCADLISLNVTQLLGSECVLRKVTRFDLDSI